MNHRQVSILIVGWFLFSSSSVFGYLFPVKNKAYGVILLLMISAVCSMSIALLLYHPNVEDD